MLSFKICIMFFLTTLSLQASDGGGHEAPPAAEHGAAKKEEKDFSGAQSDEWQQVLKDYTTAKIKYEIELKNLEHLQKEASENEGNLTSKGLEEIQKATKAVKDAEENYKRFQNQYNMRFPEKGIEKGRKYKRNESDEGGLGVDEKPQSLDAKVKKLNSKISTQYKLKNKNSKIDESQKKEIMSEDQLQKDGITEKIKLEK